MSTAAYTAAKQRRLEMRRTRRRRRSGPQLREEDRTLQQVAKTSRRRTEPPVSWPGASRASDNAAELSDISIIRMAKRCHLLDDLREDTDFETGWGRPREPGEAALAYLAFVLSGHVDVQPWWRNTSAELWWECGYAGRPRYELIRERFIELEHLAIETFFEAGAKLIRHAMDRSAGLAAFDLYIDCTEAESNVRLHHDCQPGDNCPGWGNRKRNRHGAIQQEKPDRERLLAAASSHDAEDVRQELNRGEFDPDADISGADYAHFDDARGVYRVKLGKHWWRCRDVTAGVRAITGERGAKKVWTGFYSLKISCRTFGTPIVHLVEAADIQEYHLFDEALERVLHITGEDHVRSLAFDAGFAIKDVYRQCTEHGITGVGPYRRQKLTAQQIQAGITENDSPSDHERHDRDGVPRCKHCGGETQFVRFARKPKPRVWFKCARPAAGCTVVKTSKKTGRTESLAREQSLLIGETDPRYILPLWRNTAAYQALQDLGLSMERAHNISRVRSRIGPKDNLMRPKRIGRDTQQLRANASAITDWLLVLFRQGWLPQTVLRGPDPWPTEVWEEDGQTPPARARQSDPGEWKGKDIHLTTLGEEYIYTDLRNPEQPYASDGEEFVRRMNAERRREGLDRPYGKAAIKTFGDDAPLWPRKLKRRHVDIDPGDTQLVEYVHPATGEVIALPAEADAGELIRLDQVQAPAIAENDGEHRGGAPPPDELGSSGAGRYGRPLDEPAGP